VIDIHTHLLPRIDDGSGSAQETLQLLEIMEKQGVDHVYMTPHFYADDEDPDHFLRRRERAYNIIRENDIDIRISLGAEVHYFSGIGRTNQLTKLLIEGTDCLLLEPPMKGTSRYLIDDLMTIRSKGMRPILAHLNRYPEFMDDEFVDFCNSQDILIQINTECVFDRWARRRATDLIEAGVVQFLATDCHDNLRRGPNLEEAVNILKKYLPEKVVTEFLDKEVTILGTAQ